MATGVSGLSRLADAQSRTISPENPAGVKGGAARAADGVAAAAARDLGQGWKVNPYVYVRAGETLELADIDGPGVIRQIWLTPAGCPWRLLVFRFYWDDQEKPSVECPLGDFFAAGWGGCSWSGHTRSRRCRSGRRRTGDYLAMPIPASRVTLPAHRKPAGLYARDIPGKTDATARDASPFGAH